MTVHIQLTQFEPKFTKYRTYIYGPPGVGKTSLAAEFDDVLLLSIQQGNQALGKNIPNIRVKDLSELEEAVDLIERDSQKPDWPHKILFVDTIDEVYFQSKVGICERMGLETPSDKAHGQAWEKVNSKFFTLINKMMRLPMGIVFLGHATKTNVKTPTGDYDIIEPRLKKQEDIIGAVELAFYLEGHGEKSRTLHTKPCREVSLKCRIDELPAKIELPKGNSYTAFKKVWGKAVTEHMANLKKGEENDVE